MVGRRDGLRARIRRRLGVLTWLDRTASPPEDRVPPVAPTPAPTPTAAAVEPAREGGDDVPADWVRVLSVSELTVGRVVEVRAGDRPLALANVDGALFAVDSVCPHAGGPLGDGHLDGAVLTCPWHGWSYDVRTGRSLVSDDVCVATCPVRVKDGGVWVPPSL